MTSTTDEPVVGPYLRTTILTADTSVDVVLPTNQPVAALLPSLLDLVGTHEGSSGHRLFHLDGRPLATSRTLATSGLRDGAQLRLTSVAEAPPDPIVYDLVDAVEEERPAGVWDERSRRWGLPIVAVSLLVAAAVVDGSPSVRSTGAGLGLVGLASLAASFLAAWRERMATAWACFAAAWIILPLATVLNTETRDLIWIVFAVPLLLLDAGMCARQPRSAYAGVIAWIAVVAVGGTVWGLTDDVALAAAVLVVLCGAFLGVAPRLALATAGAFDVDGQLGRGAVLRRRRVATTITAAHLSLLGAVLVVAISGAVAMEVALNQRPDDGWVLGLVATAALAWAARAHHYPLVVERLVIWGAALVGGSAAARIVADRWPVSTSLLVLALVVAAGLVAVVLLRPPTPLLAATVRRWAGRLETAAILAGLPLLVGAFGVYGAMLDTF